MAELVTVLFFAEVCADLRMSQTTGKRLKRAGAFPIPEILPRLDRKDRYSSRDVEAFKAREGGGVRLVRRRA